MTTTKTSMKGLITNSQSRKPQQEQQQVKNKSLAVIMNELVDSSGMKKRFHELLGARAPQFVGSIVSLINASPQMQEAFMKAPMTIIQAGLKAATYDLPVDPALGYAYIVPFKNKQPDGSYRMEGSFLLGYKGMYQMAMRTGIYTKLNVVDVREGELKSWNPLTEDIELEFIEDEDSREDTRVVGYCGFFRTVNGMEKYIYWSVPKIQRHEQKHRKGRYMNPVWNSNFDAMARKTILRELIGRWGIMSIDYRTASADTLKMAEQVVQGTLDDEDTPVIDMAAHMQQPEQLAESTQEAQQAVEMPADAMFSAEEIEAAVAAK